MRTTLVRTWLDWKRKRSAGEIAVDRLPIGLAPDDHAEERLLLLQALGALPPMQKAALVLRFWEDRSVDETAKILRRRPATVRSDTLRGLEKLRGLLEQAGVTREMTR